ncbi:MAG: hypothetical protein GWN07_18165 [Actinobacteria bacterium]|nr:hypothetical protein [Actinomycetota bacterium]NIS32319.1 hypothetical protein [Actinomycetota bacterium]NIU67349.1 hypothetical protein [Actinomycetota bacterium]NIW29128.1 hypothetical protein [Actinomycetota bacterium]NIX21657.1 hypothetical protein [Actinomycetota bacterium]
MEETGNPVDPHGTGQSLAQLTDGGAGLFFFDTTDGERPRDDRSNLTPSLAIDGSRWSFRGLLWIHTRRLRLGPMGGRPLALVAPAEPFEDRDGDGRHDPSKEPWIGVDPLDRLVATPGPMRLVPPGPRRRLRRPLPAEVDVALGGLLVVAGDLEVGGNAVHAGAFVVGGDADVGSSASGGARIVWDARLDPQAPAWPPPGSGVPRVRVTRVITDP